jgi:hypothetical protein
MGHRGGEGTPSKDSEARNAEVSVFVAPSRSVRRRCRGAQSGRRFEGSRRCHWRTCGRARTLDRETAGAAVVTKLRERVDDAFG